jgi:hypothetical protein
MGSLNHVNNSSTDESLCKVHNQETKCRRVFDARGPFTGQQGFAWLSNVAS